MKTDHPNDFLASMSRRVAVWGATIAGLFGLLVAINGALSDEYIGAGVCLVASSLSFAVIGIAFARK